MKVGAIIALIIVIIVGIFVIRTIYYFVKSIVNQIRNKD